MDVNDKELTGSDQAEGLRAAAPGKETMVPPRLRCIAVSSGKGGVGKTMVSISLSCHLARMGYKVLILDADLGLANVDLQMGLEPRFTLQDVVFGRCDLEDAVLHSEHGPDVLPSSNGSPEMVDMGSARRDMFVEQLITFAGGYDFLIIDVGAGIGKNITAFLQAAPEVLVVVANEPTSIMDAYAVIKVLRQRSDPPTVMMVVNMVRSLDEGELLASRLNGIVKKFLGAELPLAGVIVYDHAVGDAIRARKPITEYSGKSAPSQCLEDIARFVLNSRRHISARSRLSKDLFSKVVDAGAGVEGVNN